MVEIYLRNVRFTAFHGLHLEEGITGNEYEVNLSVTCEQLNPTIHNIDETVDYTALFRIIKRRMMQRTPLLETVATETAWEILNDFELVQEVSISIEKLNAPIENFEGKVGVRYQIKRNEK